MKASGGRRQLRSGSVEFVPEGLRLCTGLHLWSGRASCKGEDPDPGPERIKLCIERHAGAACGAFAFRLLLLFIAVRGTRRSHVRLCNIAPVSGKRCGRLLREKRCARLGTLR